jgi:hypothetical protein
MDTTQANSSPRCQHIHDNGRLCASPALRDSQFCYHHHRVHLGPPNPRLQPEAFIPFLETAESIRIAITNVARAVASGDITPQQANAIFRGIRLLESSMKRFDDVCEECSPDATELNDAMSRVLTRAYVPIHDGETADATISRYDIFPSSLPQSAPSQAAAAPKLPPATTTKTQLSPAELAHARSVIRRGPRHPEFAKCARQLDAQISSGKTA